MMPHGRVRHIPRKTIRVNFLPREAAGRELRFVRERSEKPFAL
jgi:hypothetical protein